MNFIGIFLSCILLHNCVFEYTNGQKEIYKENRDSVIPIREYTQLKRVIEDKRKVFQERYKNETKEILTSSVNIFLFSSFDEFLSFWYGTPWDFNGTTQIPQQGTIACGYFVNTILRDLGFKIPRVYWSQQASEYFIKKLCLEKDIKRFNKAPLDDIINYLKQEGEGLYLVGLDCHVGFILYKNSTIKFIHSSYYKPEIGVISEPLKGYNPFYHSNYKVIGKLFGQQMLENWILGVQYTK